MLHNITPTQFAEILAESWTLREIVSKKLFADKPRDLKQDLFDIVRSNGYNGKIQSIKDVRVRALAHEIRPLFPLNWSDDASSTLSLANSKLLVEWIGHQLGVYD